jgi:hypothetical protein
VLRSTYLRAELIGLNHTMYVYVTWADSSTTAQYFAAILWLLNSLFLPSEWKFTPDCSSILK